MAPVMQISRRRRGARLLRLHEPIAAWCERKSAPSRIFVLVYLVYVGLRHLADPDFMSLFWWLNFGIHEIGHVATRPFVPHFVYVAAGTIVQYAVPLFSIRMFFKQDDWFGAVPVCGAWLATNIYHTAWYVGDARTGLIPSAPIFGEPTTSDWVYLLSELGILHWDRGIAGVLYVIAPIVMWTSIAVGVYMGYLLVRPRKSED